MLVFPPHFATARLVLRPISATDAESAFNEYAADPLVTRYLTWRPYTDPADCAAFFAGRAIRHATGELGAYAITLRADGRLIGAFELRPEPPHRLSFGYVLGRAQWRRGYMSEALTDVVGWAMAQPDIWRAWAVTDIDNLASARVMENAGLLREGVLRRWIMHPNITSGPRDCLCYAKTR